MYSGNEEHSGILASVSRCAGTCVGTVAVAGKKITGAVTNGAAAVGNLFSRSDDITELIAERAAEVGPVQDQVKVVPRTQPPKPIREAESLIDKVEADIAAFEKQKKEKSDEARRHAKIQAESVPSHAAVTESQIKSAVFDKVTEKFLFAKAVSELLNQDVIARLDAVKALSNIAHELSVKALVAQLASDQSPRVRQECVKALTKLKIQEGLPAVKRALVDEAALVRLAAVWGLYCLAGEQSGKALVGMLRDKDEGVRRRVATCIGWLGKEKFAQDLTVLLDDSSDLVRRAAAEAMGNLGDRNMVLPLAEHLKGADRETRKVIFDAIEKITGSTIEPLPKSEKNIDRFIERWRQRSNENISE